MKSLKNFLPAIIIMILIFILSGVPGETVKAIGFSKEAYHIRGHFFLFFVLTIAYYKGFKNIMYSMLSAFIYAVTDEIHQLFVPGRAFQYLDIAVDSVGILLAGGILWKLLPILPKTLKNWLKN